MSTSPQPPEPPPTPASHPRYQIVEQIAETDFAILYRGRDLELNRDIAIKQVRPEFLAEPAKLESYWREARMLAELEHPYVINIYDVVRDRGWLILELMRGSLKQKLAGEPIDLEDLRLTLVYVLQALHCLHEKGIVHGDVKPGNLLLDKNSRIRLGDFGVAAELSNDSEIAIKGTPKYIPPEVISPEDFGEVGPSSDLYSLGFTAYELMCGDNFEQLFPGLHLYGDNPQSQWLMWHSAPDRKLPEISRVLEGVPDNLARVIEKLCEKDPKKRYQSAEKVILELKHGTDDPEKTATREEKTALEEQKAQAAKTPQKWLVFAALGLSVLMSVGLFFLPTGGGEVVEPPPKPAPTAGVVVDVDLEKLLIKIRPDNETGIHTDAFNAARDSIRVNDGKKIGLADLRVDDQITIKRLQSADGATMHINAIRPLAQSFVGKATKIETGNGFLTVQPAEGDAQKFYVPANASISVNGVSKVEGRRLTLPSLAEGDRLTIEHTEGDNGRHAVAINALRTLSFSGAVTSINKDSRELTAEKQAEPKTIKVTLPVADDATLTLNGTGVINGQEFTFLDLEPNDTINVEHDVVITRIDVTRGLTASGLVESVDPENRKIFVTVDNAGPRPIEFSLTENCPIELRDSNEVIDLSFIRPNDRIWLQHLSPELKSPVASTLRLEPVSDKRAWIVIIGQTDYEDARIASMPTAKADLKDVRDALREHYRVDEQQLLYSVDETRLKIVKELPPFIAQVPPGSQLIVYVLAHGYVSDTGQPVIAANSFDGKQMDETGLPLKWLLNAVEAAPTDDKTLILDTAHTGAGMFQRMQVSPEEMVDLLKASPEAPVSESAIVIAGAAKGETGYLLRGDERSALTTVLAEAYRGGADVDNDLRVTSNELFTYLEAELPRLRGVRGNVIHPVQFLPGEAPDLIGDDYRNWVADVIAAARDSRTTNDEWLVSYEAAMRNQPQLPQAKLAGALYFLQHNRSKTSLDKFEAIRGEHPESKVARLALAWQYFLKGNAAPSPTDQDYFRRGVGELEELVSIIDDENSNGEMTPFDEYALRVVAELYQFALKGAENPLERGTDLRRLDAQLIKLINASPETREIFVDVGKRMETLQKEVEKKIAAANNKAEKTRYEFDRHRLTYYARIDINQLITEVEDSLTRL